MKTSSSDNSLDRKPEARSNASQAGNNSPVRNVIARQEAQPAQDNIQQIHTFQDTYAAADGLLRLGTAAAVAHVPLGSHFPSIIEIREMAKLVDEIRVNTNPRETISNTDILSGRGELTKKTPANIDYRNFLDHYVNEFTQIEKDLKSFTAKELQIKKDLKSTTAKGLYVYIHQSGYRFVSRKKDNNNNQWQYVDLDRIKSRKKILQYLRDCKNKLNNTP